MSKSISSQINTNLNSKQQEAALHIEGPLLIIAGAGSGKTKMLTHRLAYILSQKSAGGVLAITFTNKAAEQMREKTRILLGQADSLEKKSLFIGTFHSFGARILRINAHLLKRTPQFSIYDSDDSLSLIKKILTSLSIDKDKIKPAAVKNEISRIKNEFIDIARYEKETDEPFAREVARIYKKYETSLEENNAFDFDDLIEKPVRVFSSYSEVLEKLQNKYRYILVDEYQDTNLAQYQLIKLLARAHKNICVVGDDAQSIYRWRWADFRNFLNFDKDWKNTKIIKLEQNYRSTKNILSAADGIIEKNSLQKKKKLWTKNETGLPISVVENQDEKAEARFVTQTIQKLSSEDGLSLKNIAVFYRTNAQSRVLEESFLKAEIPYQIIGGIKFYERKEVKDIVAYLQLVANPRDTVSLERIIAVPPRRISKERLRRLDYDLTYAPSLRELLDALNKLANEAPVSELILFLLNAISYKKYLEKEYQNAQERWENILELLSLAQNFGSPHTPPEGLYAFLESVRLMQANDAPKISIGARDPAHENSSVSLMTIHTAKGLEFDTVFVVGCEEGLLPHSRALTDPEEIEEERRLAYVAITRAKRLLYMVFCKKRLLYGSREYTAPSQFLYDIPPETTEFISTISNRPRLSEDDFSAEEEDYIEY